MTSTDSSNGPTTPRAGSSDTEIAQLHETLKRCSPATFEAACAFRRPGDLTFLRTVVIGVIERYVEREFRPKLRAEADGLRLVEDLGVDSLTMMEIVVLAEDVLHIGVSNEELVSLRTVGDIREFLVRKVSPPPPLAGPLASAAT